MKLFNIIGIFLIALISFLSIVLYPSKIGINISDDGDIVGLGSLNDSGERNGFWYSSSKNKLVSAKHKKSQYSL